LSDLFEAREIVAKAIVSEAEIDKYIKDNETRLHTNWHILQLLSRKEATIQEISEKLAAGMNFDEVAAEQFPDLPIEFKRPWDLGYLRWDQVPDAWLKPLEDLQAGQSSDIIKGENRRFWIIHLVDRKISDEFELEKSKGNITRILKQRKIQAMKKQAVSSLNAKAQIIYSDNGNN